MAKRREDVCPGCSRHCPAGSVRCGYGRKYFEKKHKAQADSEAQAEKRTKRYKWEKLVRQGGPAWQLLWVGSRSKRALRSKSLTEREMFAALDEAEQAQLLALLAKISDTLG